MYSSLLSVWHRRVPSLAQLWLPLVVVLGVSVALWLPRLRGPIDLRYDAGVYYLLGTSLAEGRGYRILSEPGEPTGVQYPPGLPLLVALHQKALGTTDWMKVAPVLRRTYFVLTLLGAAATFLYARQHLRPVFAMAAGVLAGLQVDAFFLTDLLFAETAFTGVALAFAFVLWRRRQAEPTALAEAAAFALATVGFFLRSAGLALLAAWVAEAVCRRRWRLALVRGCLALLPFLAWQAHVARVKSSDEYRNPAYVYQRAPYQFYNVSYADNIALRDPFKPELGHADAGVVLRRLHDNLLGMPAAVGSAVTTNRNFWAWGFGNLDKRLGGDQRVAEWVIILPSLLWSAIVLGGLVLLLRRGDWASVGFVIASLGLICLTPWPQQFGRYASPLTPFLVVSGMLALQMLWVTRPSRGWDRLLKGAIVGVVLVTLGVQLWVVRKVWELRRSEPAMLSPTGASQVMFFHDVGWQRWEQAVLWLKEHAAPGSVVATTSPHLCHLWTGLKSIFPPFEIDPRVAGEQLSSVPVRYLIVDELKFLDISRVYGRAAVEQDPARWRKVYSNGGTHVYERSGGE